VLHLCLPWWLGATSVPILVAWRYICAYLGGLAGSVADPDPHVFGPPRSGYGSTSQRYGSGSGSCSGSGSGSFYHHANIVRITLIPTIL
jgi:hypothetical protein